MFLTEFFVLAGLRNDKFLFDLRERFDASVSLISKSFTLRIIFLYLELP